MSTINIVSKIPAGFPTHSKDVNGETICMGDIVDYDYKEDTPQPFEVVFEDNAFRKKYLNREWPEGQPLPYLEIREMAQQMRLKIIKKAEDKWVDFNRLFGNFPG